MKTFYGGRNASPKMNLYNFTVGQLINNLSDDNKSNFRKIEKLNKSLVNKQNGILFNETCIKEMLLPKYTEIRQYVPVARNQKFTMDYRENVLKFQLEQHKQNVPKLINEITEITNKLFSNITEEQLRTAVFARLDDLKMQEERIARNRITQKLNNLYNGKLMFPQQHCRYINLSQHELTSNQKDVLSLGNKCHYKQKFDPLKKHMEVEMLYESLIKLQDKELIHIGDNLKPQLAAEATKRRDFRPSTILTNELKVAAAELKNHKDIIVRRADKSNTLVVMDRIEYKNKLDSILADDQKFSRITKNPTNTLKTNINKLIAAVNKDLPQKVLSPITG